MAAIYELWTPRSRSELTFRPRTTKNGQQTRAPGFAGTHERRHVLVGPSVRPEGMSSGVQSSDLVDVVVDTVPV